jgi:tRNA G18 (ribose-2'-O)-methylase SpoU
MPVIPIDTLDDARLHPYRNLKDAELARQGDRFVAEGERIVLRLLASGYAVESVVCSPRRVAELSRAMIESKSGESVGLNSIPIFVLPDREIDRLVGFRFHNGVLAIGRRGPRVPFHRVIASVDAGQLLVICPDLNNAENLGSILRIAAGMGVDAVLLGPRSVDPFYRQSIRVSMGAALTLPIGWMTDEPTDLLELRDRLGFDVIGSVCDPPARSSLELRRSARTALVVGAEAHGLSAPVKAACSRLVTIPMHLGTDSLNVAIAAAVLLYQINYVSRHAREEAT